MSKSMIGLIIMGVVLAAVIVFLYYWGKKQEKRQAEQEALMEQMAQQCTMLVIDKKKVRLNKSGLPKEVIEGTPWMARRSKVPVVQAKIGPKIVLLISENSIFDSIPVKKEIKATVSGIYITQVKGIRGAIEAPKKQQTWLTKLLGIK